MAEHLQHTLQGLHATKAVPCAGLGYLWARAALWALHWQMNRVSLSQPVRTSKWIWLC